MKTLYYSLFLLGITFVDAKAAYRTYFVAPNGHDTNPGTLTQPFKTIQKARDHVRPLRAAMNGDIIINVRGGTYSVTEPIAFTSQDSGLNGHNIVYQAYQNEQPIISGGSRVTGWTLHTNGIYKATVAYPFRQLYVNGDRAIRARFPNLNPENPNIRINQDDGSWIRMQPLDPTNRVLVLNQVDVPKVPTWTGTEIIVQSHWVSAQANIASVVNKPNGKAWVNLVENGITNQRTALIEGVVSLHIRKHPNYSGNCHFENSLAFLDAPGEWFYNSSTKTLYYKPRQGENIHTATIIAPRAEQLLTLRGTAQNFIQNLQFKGFTFTHTTWNLPTGNGFSYSQALLRLRGKNNYDKYVPGAVEGEFARNIRFEKNSFQLLGATALNFVKATYNTQVIGNEFTEISGNGISYMYYETTDSLLHKNDIINHNYVSKVGQDYYGAVGILGVYVQNMRVEHNEIHDTPYTGISIGWGWRIDNNTSRNNLIRANRIYRVMNLIDDGGGIYTLSYQQGTYIRDNYIHDVLRQPTAEWTPKYPLVGIYLDQGFKGMTLTNNHLVRVPHWQGYFTNTHNGPGTYATNVKIYKTSLNPTNVIANAGPQPPYKRTSSTTPLPLSTITIARTMNPAQEHGLQEGQFTITRTSPLSNSVTIHFTKTGTATEGLDYNTIPNSVTIPSGTNSVIIEILPKSDSLIEGPETVTLRLATNSAYTVGTPSSATVTIDDMPADQWKKEEFTSNELTNASISGDHADPDGDGLPNLAEYALGSSPKTPSLSAAPQLTTVTFNNNSFMAIRFTMPAERTDVRPIVEASRDLNNWKAITEAAAISIEEDASDRHYTVRDVVRITHAERRFLRVRFERVSN